MVTRVKKKAGATIRRKGTKPTCACGCGRAAEISFGETLFYTRDCFQKEIDGLRALGIPIEQGPEGIRLAPSVTVEIIDDAAPVRAKTKLH